MSLRIESVTRIGHSLFMVKVKSSFACDSCGQIYPKWEGKCIGCGNWNSISERLEPLSSQQFSLAGSLVERGMSLEILSNSLPDRSRMKSGIMDFDRIFGGGIGRGSAVVIGGEPGVGKSTLGIQLANGYSQSGLNVLYISAEETLHQVAERMRRLNVGADFSVVGCKELSSVIDEISEVEISYDLVFVDSIQALVDGASTLSPYSANQMRLNAERICMTTKSRGAAVIMFSQITKDGTLLGPKAIEHLVDVVAYFEKPRDTLTRTLTVHKNRFGPTPEFAEYELSDQGLVYPVEESRLVPSSGKDGFGRGYIPVLNGTRLKLIEVQALVATPGYDTQQRLQVEGFDQRRLAMLMYILDAKLGTNLASKFVMLQVANGKIIKDHAADLGIALAVLSALAKVPLKAGVCGVGEVSLLGELRPVGDAKARSALIRFSGLSALICNGDKSEEGILAAQSIDRALQLAGLPYSALKSNKMR